MKISVITATYNCNDVIDHALKSINNQTYDNIEHIVIDGGSVDGTVEKLKQNTICKLVSESDDGIYDALNKGIQAASGDVIGILHSDDEFASKDIVSKIAEEFSSDSSVSAVYGDLIYVHRKDSTRMIRYWKSKPFDFKMLTNGWMPPHPTLYVKKDFYEELGGYNLNYKIAADYSFVLSLFSSPNFKSVYLPEVIVKMKLGGASNHSIKAIFNKSLEDWRILRNFGFNSFACFSTLTMKNLSKLNKFRFK